LQATQPNEIWTLDFVSDRLLHGRAFRALTLLDENSKYCFAVDPAFSYPSASVVKALENAAVEQACPKYLRVDNELSTKVNPPSKHNDARRPQSRAGTPLPKCPSSTQ
jgi:transposase InsO family protein